MWFSIVKSVKQIVNPKQKKIEIEIRIYNLAETLPTKSLRKQFLDNSKQTKELNLLLRKTLAGRRPEGPGRRPEGCRSLQERGSPEALKRHPRGSPEALKTDGDGRELI